MTEYIHRERFQLNNNNKKNTIYDLRMLGGRRNIGCFNTLLPSCDKTPTVQHSQVFTLAWKHLYHNIQSLTQNDILQRTL